MASDWLLIPTAIAALGAGLIAGLFFAFSTFVMRALSQLPAGHAIAAMQSINSTIVRSLFVPVFLGTALACVVVAGIAMWRGAGAGAPLVGSALYLIGVIGVTMVCNVPQNDALAAIDPTSADAARAWGDYLARWQPWNHVRTVSACGALLAFLFALRA